MFLLITIDGVAVEYIMPMFGVIIETVHETIRCAHFQGIFGRQFAINLETRGCGKKGIGMDEIEVIS
jgi:hypothetical protein